MASLVKQPLLSLLPTCNTTTQSPKQYPFAFKSSQSHFHGLNLISSIPSCLTVLISKTSLIVSAKVNKGSVPRPFTLKDQYDRNVSPSKFRGKPAVVYFYHADKTP